MLINLTPGGNFTKILSVSCKRVGPKKLSSHPRLFILLGSTRVKVAGKMLVKLIIMCKFYQYLKRTLYARRSQHPSSHQHLCMLLGSTDVKAAGKMLVK